MKTIKKIIAMTLLSLALVVAFVPVNVFAVDEPTFSGGKGTQEEPWLISKSVDLVELSNFVNNGYAEKFDADNCGNDIGNFHGYYFKQTTDIDLNGIIGIQ